MTPAAGARRDKAGRGVHHGLTLEVVVDRAMLLAAQRGRAGLSMRRLGEALGVQAMSLYHYLPDKATLMALMADRSAAEVLAGIDDSDDLAWAEQLTTLTMVIYSCAVRNPAFADALTVATILPDGPAGQSPAIPAGPLTELLIWITALLGNAALTGRELSYARDGLLDLVVGPAARAHTPAAAGPDLRAGMRFAVTTFLTGVAAQHD